jgi:hypothetical protein
MHGPCQTCRVLSKSLNDVRERYAVAALQRCSHRAPEPPRMGELAGAGRANLFNAAQLEAQSLHVECEALKAELNRDRAEDQLTEG